MYNQRDNETFADWKLRLITSKIEKECDLDWIEIRDLLGEDCSPDHLRKKAQGIYEYRNYFDEKLEESLPEDKLDELTIKKLELQKERNKLQAEKIELNKWIREQARTENIQEKIELAISKLKPITSPPLLVRRKNGKKTMTVDIADAHYGREGKVTGFHGETIAEYSIEIFERRMYEILEHTIQIAKKEDISHVHVINLGDQLDGILRLTQLQFLQLGAIDSAMNAAEFLSHWLNKLSEYVTVEYHSVLGNHAEYRVGNVKSGDLKQENLEKVIPWFIKERLKDNSNVIVHDPKFIQIIDVLGTKICLTHGQDEKNLEQSIKDYSMIYGEQIHMLRTGHLHHLNNKAIGMSGLQNIEYVQVPSICGIDEFSLRLKKTSNAGTLITIFEEGYGKLCTYDIRLI